MHLTPAQVAIAAFGNQAKLCQAIGSARSAPARWLGAREGQRSQPGDIPVPQIRAILAVAKVRGLALTAEDLIYGRDVPDDAPLPEVSDSAILS